MARPLRLSQFKRVSGGSIGRNSKRILGCENCNFMELHSAPPKAQATKPVNPLKTGSVCPRCSAPLLRVYDSQAEFGRGQELKLMRSAGLIENLQFQVPYTLHATTPDGRKIALYKYVADFTYDSLTPTPNTTSPPVLSAYVVEDVKPKGGLVTDVFMMKKKHFEAEYGIDLLIVER